MNILRMLFAAALLLGTTSQAIAGQVALTGKGEATYDKKKDAIVARERAIENATKQAVRKSLTTYVTPEILEKKAEDIDIFLETAVAMVQRTEIVKEEDLNGTYSVIIKAMVDEEVLKENLKSSGFSMDVGSRRTVAVLIDEYFAGDTKPTTEPMVAEEVNISTVDYNRDSSVDQQNDVKSAESASYKERSDASMSSRESAAVVDYSGAAAASSRSSASASSSSSGAASSSYRDKSSLSAKESESMSAMTMSVKKYFPPEALKQPRPDPASAAAIAKLLGDRDVRLVDNKVAAEMRSALIGPDGMFGVMADPASLSAKATQLGSKYSADAVMIGVTAIVYNGVEDGRHRATANLAIRVVDSATGDILASTVKVQSGSGTDSQTAATEAARRLGELIGRDLGEQMFTYWKKRDEKGIEVSVRIMGVTSTKVKLAAEEVLRAVKGAEGLEERMFDRTNGILEFIVTTKRPLNEFKSDMLKGLYARPDFEKLEEEMSLGSNLNFKLQ